MLTEKRLDSVWSSSFISSCTSFHPVALQLKQKKEEKLLKEQKAKEEEEQRQEKEVCDHKQQE